MCVPHPGIQIRTVLHPIDKSDSYLMEFNIQLSHILDSKSRPEDSAIKEKLQQSPYKHNEGSGDGQQEGVVLDVKKFTTEHQVVTGKDGYDKNLQLIKSRYSNE